MAPARRACITQNAEPKIAAEAKERGAAAAGTNVEGKRGISCFELVAEHLCFDTGLCCCLKMWIVLILGCLLMIVAAPALLSNNFDFADLRMITRDENGSNLTNVTHWIGRVNISGNSKVAAALLDTVLVDVVDSIETSVAQYERVMQEMKENVFLVDVFQILEHEGLLSDHRKQQLKALNLHESRMSRFIVADYNNSHWRMVGSSRTSVIESDQELNAGKALGRQLIETEDDKEFNAGTRVPAMDFGWIMYRIGAIWQHHFRNRSILRRKSFWFVFLTIALVGTISMLGCMMPTGFRNPPPRNTAHVGDAGPPYVGTATLKVPPAWSAERAH